MANSVISGSANFRIEDGIYVDSAWEPFAVTDQFIAEASTYHEKYYDNGYWTFLVEKALKLTPVDTDASLRVLDIGSGSGNTVFPLANLLPNSTICANDISPQLLKILSSIQHEIPALNGRIEAYCFDLHKNFFAERVFDLIVGGAILHHILDPKTVLSNAAKWIRPGGTIVLIEPMEIGGHMMAAVYLTLLAEVGQDAKPELIKHFRAMIRDYEARFGLPLEKPWTQSLDDKWLFHPAYLRDVADEVGLNLTSITPTLGLEAIFTDMVKGTLGLTGIPLSEVPPKTWDILREFDEGVSMSVKKRLTPEGIICLSKPR